MKHKYQRQPDPEKVKKAEIPSTDEPLAEKDEIKQAEIRTQKAQADAEKHDPGKKKNEAERK